MVILFQISAALSVNKQGAFRQGEHTLRHLGSIILGEPPHPSGRLVLGQRNIKPDAPGRLFSGHIPVNLYGLIPADLNALQGFPLQSGKTTASQPPDILSHIDKLNLSRLSEGVGFYTLHIFRHIINVSAVSGNEGKAPGTAGNSIHISAVILIPV